MGPELRVYHRTTRARVESILAEGFEDATGTCMSGHAYSGTEFSAGIALDINEGADGGAAGVGSSGRTRTYNPSVNSRMLYH